MEGLLNTYNKSINQIRLFKTIAGVPTLIGSYTCTVANSDRIRINALNDSIKVFQNDVEIISVIESFYTTATKIGL